ncbi:MAG: exo-alpha-sialidase [Oscillospiraceae bacterium]|nr:exo-alpha-sialidase [Oscillospiraceae bacterium]
MKRRISRILAACAALVLPMGLPAAAADDYPALEGTLLGRITILDTDYYDSWAVDPSLGPGDAVFGDRSAERCAVAACPDFLTGAELLLTPCDAKNSDADQAVVTAAQDLVLYVGLDSRVETPPAWLGGWTQDAQVLTTTNDVTFVLYALPVEAGRSVTLGTNGQVSGCMNYIVAALPDGTPEPAAGDVNGDGVFSLLDVVRLQKWLLRIDGTRLADWQTADLCPDEKLDTMDLVLMKRMLRTGVVPGIEAPAALPCFTVADGLFDQSNTDTLGLRVPEGLETVTVWRADDASDHYCNGVCLAAFGGKLYCQWQSSQTDEDSADTHVMYAVSSDGGRTWSDAKVLIQSIGDGYCTSGGWLSAGDRLIAYINFWDNGLSVRGGWTYYMTSEDGENWSSPQPVTMADGTPLNGVFEQDPHVLANGRIVNAAHFQDGLFVCPIYTDDPTGISGWRKGAFTPSGSGTSSTEMEPSLFVQQDGTLVMIFRDQSSSYRKLCAYSRDNGVTWSRVQKTDMPDARTKQSAGNLSDGTAFLAGCPVENSLRSPLAVTLSADGRHFDRAYLLRSNESDPALMYEGKAKRLGFHYCKSLVYDGSLYVGYATNKEAVEISIVPEASLT